MTFNDWLGLSEGSRRRAVAKGKADFDRCDSDLFAIYERTGEKLARSLAEDPRVTGVHIARSAETRLPVLLVTSLRGLSVAGELKIPSSYLGFDVVHRSVRTIRNQYLRAFNKILAETIGWAPKKTAVWRQRLNEGLEGRNPMFYHRSPSTYAADAIVEARVGMPLSGKEMATLRNQIVAAIEGMGQNRVEFPNEVRNYDWDAARMRIDRVFSTKAKGV